MPGPCSMMVARYPCGLASARAVRRWRCARARSGAWAARLRRTPHSTRSRMVRGLPPGSARPSPTPAAGRAAGPGAALRRCWPAAAGSARSPRLAPGRARCGTPRARTAPDPVVGRGQGQARLGQRRQRARPVSLSGGQPGDPGVDRDLQDRAAVDPCRVPRCGQQGRGGLVFAPLQVDPRRGQVGEASPNPCATAPCSAAAPAARSSAAPADTRSPCRNATQAVTTGDRNSSTMGADRGRCRAGGRRPHPRGRRPAGALRLPGRAAPRASGTAGPARPRR